jgi:F0F1-type ATP synthase membrane subunit c/vacuolar-type H+-ATPase subunit K
MFTNMILMAGLTEAVAIYALVISILLIFVA